MGSVGGSKQASSNWSESSSGGTTGSQASSGQSVWGQQAGALGDLYAQARAMMGGGSPYAQQSAQAQQAGQAAWNQMLVPGQNPYFDQSVQASIDQATDSFKRQVLPELDARSAGVGQLGSSRDRLATGEATGLFGQGLAQSTAKQYADQYAGDQGRALQAVSMTPQFQQSAFAPLTTAAQMIGGPTVLSQSQSSGWGNNWANLASGGSGSGKSAQLGVLAK